MKNNYTHDLIVIGAGAAGLTLTAGAAQLGMKVALIEREHMGGDCLYQGCVPSKSLIRAGHIWDEVDKLENFGLPKISNRPTVDITKVLDRVHDVIEHIAPNDSVERYKGLGADVVLGDAKFLSSHTIEVNTKKETMLLSAPKITIATGSSSLIIPFEGLDTVDYITNRDVFKLKKIPKKLLVIGAGPIGIELSQALNNLGSEITILTKTNQILSIEDSDMAKFVQTALEENNIKIYLNVTVKKILKEANLKKVEYTIDGKSFSWSGDTIMIATGRKGSIEGLNLEKAGVQLNGRFIKVNKALQTTQKHILAIGDVNGKYLFTHVAGSEGSLAVRRQVLGLGGSMSYKNVPWVTYTSPELASIGYNEKRAKAANIKYKVVEASFDDNDRACTEGRTKGKIKILFDKNERVIGTQIVGPDAGSLITPAIYAVNNKWKLSKLYSPMLPYPTLSELYKKAIGEYMGKKLFNNKIRKTLRVLKGYRGK